MDTGIGLASPRAVAVAPGGVYFLAHDGVYFTTGGDPQIVSRDIGPVFRDGAGAPAAYQGGYLARAHLANSTMEFYEGRLYLGFTGNGASTNNRTFVYDPRVEVWSLWDFPAACFATLRVSGVAFLLFGRASGDNHVEYYLSFSAEVDDEGTSITSRYRSGFYDFGTEEEKTIVETQLWGTGTAGFALSRDFGSLDTPASVALGASPVIANGRSLIDKTGTLFSHQFSSVNGGAWAVHRCTPYLREQLGSASKRS